MELSCEGSTDDLLGRPEGKDGGLTVGSKEWCCKGSNGGFDDGVILCFEVKASDGHLLGNSIGFLLGIEEGKFEGQCTGQADGRTDGSRIGCRLGHDNGCSLGSKDGYSIGCVDDSCEGSDKYID